MTRYCPNCGSELTKTIEDYDRGYLRERVWECPVCDYEAGYFEGKRYEKKEVI